MEKKAWEKNANMKALHKCRGDLVSKDINGNFISMFQMDSRMDLLFENMWKRTSTTSTKMPARSSLGRLQRN